jgi:hypothetical protein
LLADCWQAWGTNALELPAVGGWEQAGTWVMIRGIAKRPDPSHRRACLVILADRTHLGPVRRAAPQTPRHLSAGCHRPRIPDRVIFDKLIQVLVFGCAYARIADHTCSERTLRRRPDEWIDGGIMAALEGIARDGYDHMLGLKLHDLAVDGCITKAPCGGQATGRSPVDRGSRA